MNPDTVKKAPGSDELMEAFLRASASSGNTAREIYLARETLLSILRVAKAEQLLDIRRSVDKLIPASMRPQTPRRGKGRPSSRKQPGQIQIVFGRES